MKTNRTRAPRGTANGVSYPRPRGRRSALPVAAPGIIAAALLVAPLASAEIYECAAKDGTALYQNFPCQFDSLGSLPSQPLSVTVPSASVESTQAKPKSVALEKTAMSAQSRHPARRVARRHDP